MADNIMRNQAHVKDVSQRKGIADNIGDMIIDTSQNIFFKTAWATYKQMPTSVNNVTPDDTGNITISTGGGSGSVSFGVYNAWWSTPFTVLTILTNQATDNAISSVTVNGQTGTLGTPVTIGSGMQTQTVTFSTAIEQENANSATIALTTGSLTIGLDQGMNESSPTPTQTTPDIYGATLVQTASEAYTLEIFVDSTWYDDGGDVFSGFTELGENTWSYDTYSALDNNVTMVTYTTTSSSQIALTGASLHVATTITPKEGSSPLVVPLNYTSTIEPSLPKSATTGMFASFGMTTSGTVFVAGRPFISLYIPKSFDASVSAGNYALTNTTLSTNFNSVAIDSTSYQEYTKLNFQGTAQTTSNGLAQQLNTIASQFFGGFDQLQITVSGTSAIETGQMYIPLVLDFDTIQLLNSSSPSLTLPLNATDTLQLYTSLSLDSNFNVRLNINGGITSTAQSVLGATATAFTYPSTSGFNSFFVSQFVNMLIASNISTKPSPILDAVLPDGTTFAVPTIWSTTSVTNTPGLTLQANPSGQNVDFPIGTVFFIEFSTTVNLYE